MPVSNLDVSTVLEGLPAEFVQSWSTAIATLTDRELSAMVLRFGFRTGKPESFAAIGRELGENRVRAKAIFTNALGRLGRMEKTRALARYLADLNAALSSGAEAVPSDAARSDQAVAVQHLRRRAPAIEETRYETLNGGSDEDALEIDRGAPAIDAANSDAAAPIGDGDSAVDQDEPADREEEVADEPVSERDALKLVHAADRELARAIEQCFGREDLLAELQRARTRVATGMREIEQTPTVHAVKQVSSPTGKRRGRPANDQETARRAAVLERVQAGEISNAEAATEIGIAYGTWAGWKALYRRRMGEDAVRGRTARSESRPAETSSVRRGRGRPENTVETARRAALLARVNSGEITNAEAAADLGIMVATWASWRSYHAKRAGRPGADDTRVASEPHLEQRLARLEELERFGKELKARLKALLRFVEERAPR
ncbi:MAG: hypothetical protein IPN34_21015 [Planctomycetes bacterium]|nr:hypothetical protein [Planctomycetota bacterium]